MQPSRVATAGGFGAVLLWSTTIPVVRSLSEQVGSVTAASAVFAVSGVIALVSLLWGPRKWDSIKALGARHLLGCGSLFVGYMLLLFLAIGWADGRQQVLEVGLVNYLWPALTLILSLVIVGRKAAWATFIPGTLLALLGMFLVLTQGASVSWQSLTKNVAGNPAAYFLALAAAVSWALYNNLTEKWFGKEENAVVVFLPITAIFLLLICFFLDEPRAWTNRALVEALFLGIVTAVAYSLWEAALISGEAETVTAASYLTPLFSTILNCLYLDIEAGLKLWVGCLAIVLGSFLSWRSTRNVAPGSGGRHLNAEN
ncbi:MAG: aromatic amino acid DMT transporter YddG [Desulfobacterales bacterium]